MIVTSSLAIITGWIMCAVFTKGKEEDKYWEGYDAGYRDAMETKYILRDIGEWQSKHTV